MNNYSQSQFLKRATISAADINSIAELNEQFFPNKKIFYLGSFAHIDKIPVNQIGLVTIKSEDEQTYSLIWLNPVSNTDT